MRSDVLGAQARTDGVLFRVWAPEARKVAAVLGQSRVELTRGDDGIFAGLAASAKAGTRYRFAIDDATLPDPYGRFFPDGVHGDAEVLANTFVFKAPMRPIDLRHAHAIYELHIGTFTPEGTYAAAAEKLPYLRELGVTTLEIMPLSAFAGSRGWGYDGVALYAPHAPYGRPEELCAFVDQAHAHGLSVVLDLVLNHFGPSGNYLSAYTPRYFAEERHTLWGAAPAFDEPHLRRLMIDAVLHWLEVYHFDGIRLDATHAIIDPSAVHVLRDVADAVSRLTPRRILIAEDERKEPAILGALGMDAVWADDFHHAAHVLLTGEQHHYYAKYAPTPTTLADVFKTVMATGGYHRLISCLQNHDQVGNRAFGERLNHLVSPEAFTAASLVLLSLPMTPLLFQGQEWAARSPFLYFTDHEPALGEAIIEGRRREFGLREVPDPQALETFERSKLQWAERDQPWHRDVWRMYQSALRRRTRDPVLSHPAETALRTHIDGNTVTIELRNSHGHRRVIWDVPNHAVFLGGE